MDAAQLGAVGTIAVGLAAAIGALIGKRGENRANHSGAVLGGYSTLVDNLQEERNTLQAKLAENDRLLTAAYAELTRERADKAALHARIAELTAENAQLRERIVELGGQPT
ncbi:hypothetical protein ACFWIK_00950 [Streptomyces anthocyanicus]|uniref:hypothetical protein n=1 Tax=Streptomyces anthocyanicus TaxID=68174 RepID=UPI003658DA1D